MSDAEIELTSVAGLPKQKPTESIMSVPGVIWIKGTATVAGEPYEFNERIEYFRRDGTTLKHIRRGTCGTTASIPAIYDSSGDLIADFKTITDVVYPAGSVVIDSTEAQRIPGGYEWTPASSGSQFENNLQYNFLKSKPGSC